MLQETDQNGVTTATYTSTAGSVYAPLVGIRNSSGSHVPLPDALGSVRVLLDSSQNLTDGYAFEGFGSQVSGGGATPNPYRYVGLFGYYEDQGSGLMLLSRRYYDAEAGRFLTRDPIDYASGDWDMYGYARNGPVGGTDATGLDRYSPCDHDSGWAKEICKWGIDAVCHWSPASERYCCDEDRQSCEMDCKISVR